MVDQALKYKRAGGPWYQMRDATSYTDSAFSCGRERAAAYNSELIGGTGWFRTTYVAPGEKVCLSVWVYGNNLFSPKGYKGRVHPLGAALVTGPPAPSP